MASINKQKVSPFILNSENIDNVQNNQCSLGKVMITMPKEFLTVLVNIESKLQWEYNITIVGNHETNQSIRTIAAHVLNHTTHDIIPKNCLNQVSMSSTRISSTS